MSYHALLLVISADISHSPRAQAFRISRAESNIKFIYLDKYISPRRQLQFSYFVAPGAFRGADGAR